MSRFRNFIIAFLILNSIGKSAFANDTGSILDHTIGAKFNNVQNSLEQKGYSVSILKQNYKVDPSKVFDSFLVATGPKSEKVRKDELVFVSDLHPYAPQSIAITREILYNPGQGPSLEKFRNDLMELMGPSSIEYNEPKSSMTNVYSFKYRWSSSQLEKDNPMTRKCLENSALRPNPEVQGASLGHHKVLVFAREGQKIMRHDLTKQDVIFFNRSCYRLGYVRIEVNTDSQLVNLARISLIDHSRISFAIYDFREWYAKAKLSYNSNENKGAVPDN